MARFTAWAPTTCRSFPRRAKTSGRIPGVVSFPWELALLLHFGVHQRNLPLSRLVALNSYHPARRFGLWPRKGSLQSGADADLVLVDLDEERTVHHTGMAPASMKAGSSRAGRR